LSEGAPFANLSFPRNPRRRSRLDRLPPLSACTTKAVSEALAATIEKPKPDRGANVLAMASEISTVLAWRRQLKIVWDLKTEL
jgi:hypothetical protein